MCNKNMSGKRKFAPAPRAWGFHDSDTEDSDAESSDDDEPLSQIAKRLKTTPPAPAVRPPAPAAPEVPEDHRSMFDQLFDSGDESEDPPPPADLSPPGPSPEDWFSIVEPTVNVPAKAKAKAAPSKHPSPLPHMQPVPGEGEKMWGHAYNMRAGAFRQRARAIFEYEKRRIIASPHLTSERRLEVSRFQMHFDRATSRRGVCQFPGKRNGQQSRIGISGLVIDRGFPAENVRLLMIHELSHAAAGPGAKHSPVWKALNLKLGGDGQRCDGDDAAAAIVGHKIEVWCSHCGREAGVIKRQTAPSQQWFRANWCTPCLKAKRPKPNWKFKRCAWGSYADKPRDAK